MSQPRRMLRRIREIVDDIPLVGPRVVDIARRVRDVGVSPAANSSRDHPARFRAPGPRIAPAGTWQEPPAVDGEATEIVARRHADEAPPLTYDIELFEALNAEYASKPLVPDPPRYDEAAMRDRARSRLRGVDEAIDLGRKRVLEFGCGPGYELWTLTHAFDAEGWGVDIVQRRSWATLEDERTHYRLADLAIDRPFEANMFDRVVSFTVFEHVEHPHAALAELHRVLRPGGLAWIKANLHRGPMASHRYRQVFFPFPHLLFTDEVMKEFQRRNGLAEEGSAWVNRLTWADYEALIGRVGFRIRMLRFSGAPLDEAFYARFEDILGRYPRTDLTRDFFEVVLEKPGSWASLLPSPAEGRTG